jgi:DNA-binding Lrp family transcriptional regulator
MTPLAPLARAFVNRYQGCFPLAGRPFARVAAELGATEDDLIAVIRELLASGLLSRFGAIYDASRLGGGQTLAAMEVPEARFERVAAAVNAMPEIAHNYRRAHRLNMWFVVAAPTPAAVEAALAEVGRLTGLAVYNFPKEHEFYLGLWLKLGTDAEVTTVPAPRRVLSSPVPLDGLDRRIIAATQAGWPLVPEPCEAIAEALGEAGDVVLERLQRMLASGAIRRVGAVPNHYRLGLKANGMSVWDVPDERAVELGERVGGLDFVSHCYLRPRRGPVWPYNLFAMVHGRVRAQVFEKTALIRELLGPAVRHSEVLFSTAVLKKTGLRLAA